MFNEKIWKYQLRDALIYWIYIPASVIATGKVIDMLFGFSLLPDHAAVSAAAVLLLVCGSAIIWISMNDLTRHGGGTANPLYPPRALVSQGVYSISRHPMFLGYDIAALGVVLLFHSISMLVISYPLFMYFEIRFLKREEALLEKRFQDKFIDYRDKVSFLIPGIGLKKIRP